MSKSRSAAAAAPAVPCQEVRELLIFATSSETLSLEIAERRQKLLSKLCNIIQADLGVWSWGRGSPLTGGIQPMAMIEHEMKPSQKACLAEMGIDRKNDLEFRSLIMPMLNSERQATVIRNDVYSDAAWKRRPYFRRLCEGLGMAFWLLSIRYVREDTWSTLAFWRKPDHPEFAETESRLIDLAMGSISWLHPTVAEALPPEIFVGITPRQRTVLLLLLDGMPRKAVARHLGLTENTVGDHIKSIYQHYQVHSLGELVARMLKSG